MFAVLVVFMIAAALIAVLAAYMRRIYSEYGKILSGEIQDNLDAWEESVEPRLGLSREHAALSAAVLEQMMLGTVALLVGAVVFDRRIHPAVASYGEIAQAALAIVVVVLFCGQIVPTLLFVHSAGRWAARLVWPVRMLLWLTTPATLFVRFFFSIASLAVPPADPEEESAGDVEALLEAGEEEGILEEADRDLVRSAVEFGDKLVREVMTPRPEVFAVPAGTTIEQFLELLRDHNFSRVPVFAGTFDNVTGIAFAHDLLQIADAEARTRTVADIEKPAAFVPETKRGYELLREMQREKQHMRIVIDEYGGVAGVVTIEDLLEQIVGTIRDEHEMDAPIDEPEREVGGSWLVPGSFPVGQLGDLFGAPFELDDSYEATTLGGLVSEIEGRIPMSGEVVLLDHAGLRIEVIQSSDRRVERLRIFPPAQELEAASAS